MVSIYNILLITHYTSPHLAGVHPEMNWDLKNVFQSIQMYG